MNPGSDTQLSPELSHYSQPATCKETKQNKMAASVKNVLGEVLQISSLIPLLLWSAGLSNSGRKQEVSVSSPRALRNVTYHFKGKNGWYLFPVIKFEFFK